jgi:hypothetical protein
MMASIIFMGCLPWTVAGGDAKDGGVGDARQAVRRGQHRASAAFVNW